MEVEGGLAAAFEVPTAFKDELEEDFLEGARGEEILAEAGFELGKGFGHGGEYEESSGGEAVTQVVARRGGFARFGARSGGELGVGAIRRDLLFGCHCRDFLCFL